MKKVKVDPLKPSLSLLCKLGSILVHLEEFHSPTGHSFDLEAMKSALSDPEVKDWLGAMDLMAFIPKKR